jgi:hypothetical protein
VKPHIYWVALSNRLNSSLGVSACLWIPGFSRLNLIRTKIATDDFCVLCNSSLQPGENIAGSKSKTTPADPRISILKAVEISTPLQAVVILDHVLTHKRNFIRTWTFVLKI